MVGFLFSGETACSYAFPYRCGIDCSDRQGAVVKCRRACRARGAFSFALETCIRADFAGLNSIGHRKGRFGVPMLSRVDGESEAQTLEVFRHLGIRVI